VARAAVEHWLRRVLEFDAAVARQLNRQVRRSTGAQRAAQLAASSLAPAEVVLMVGLATRGQVRAALRMVVGVGAVYVLSEGFGRALQRARPFESGGAVEGVEGLISHRAGRSFPSRHVASALAMATIARQARPGWGQLMEALGWLGGVSRVAAGVHFPSDVVAGALLGKVVATIIVRSNLP
jgi:membrane-associated phospholipid phosphatase